MTDLATLKARLLENPEVRAEYEAMAPEFEISEALIGARQRAGLSQAEVARKMGTTQSVVARLESGRFLPSTASLTRYAAATNSHLHIDLRPR